MIIISDLNSKGKDMSKQSLSIMKRGSALAPLEKMRSKLGKPVKSSGYGKEQKVVMFQPSINRPRVKQTSSEPDLTQSNLQPEGSKERRARWSLGSSTAPSSSSSSTSSSTSTTTSGYIQTEQPPTQLTGRLRLWEESARSVVAFSPSGKHVAVSGGRNIIQVVPSTW